MAWQPKGDRPSMEGLSPNEKWVWSTAAPWRTRGRSWHKEQGLRAFTPCSLEQQIINFSHSIINALAWFSLHGNLRPRGFWSKGENCYLKSLPSLRCDLNSLWFKWEVTQRKHLLGLGMTSLPSCSSACAIKKCLYLQMKSCGPVLNTHWTKPGAQQCTERSTSYWSRQGLVTGGYQARRSLSGHLIQPPLLQFPEPLTIPTRLGCPTALLQAGSMHRQYSIHSLSFGMCFINALRTTRDLQTELQWLVPVQKQRDHGAHGQQAQILHYFVKKTPLLLMHEQISKRNPVSSVHFASPIKVTVSLPLQVPVLP